jgi:hypothetical protein
MVAEAFGAMVSLVGRVDRGREEGVTNLVPPDCVDRASMGGLSSR